MQRELEVELGATQDDVAKSVTLDGPGPATPPATVAEPAKSTDVHVSKSSASLRLIPIVRVSRDKIPLAWLDTTHVFEIIKRDCNAGRIFTNYSNALADWFRGGDKVSKAVQIVREKMSGRLCAVERVRYGDYAICAIGSWVSEDLIIGKRSTPFDPSTQLVDVAAKPVANMLQARRTRKYAEPIDRWWENKPLENTNVLRTPTITDTSKEQLSVECEAGQADAASMGQSEPAVISLHTPLRTPSAAKKTIHPFDITTAAPALPETSDTLFERFLKQYLDALYMQKTSLAFFAKGPLARLRTALNNASEASEHKSPLLSLTTFLRGMIINPKVMEKKYKDKLPPIINDSAMGSSDRECTVATSKRKARKVKLKPNKAGLYDDEAKFVCTWWITDDSGSPSSTETREQQIKRRLELLRVRETLLQIVVVLEIVSVEGSNEWKAASAEQQIDDKSAGQSYSGDGSKQSEPSADMGGTENIKHKRQSKQLDLSLHLDLLVDRIAIWHSLKYETDTLSTEVGRNKSSLKTWATDILGAFCIDVVVPFFKHRIPEQVNVMVKKFGGPVASPQKSHKRHRQDGSKTEHLPKTAARSEKTSQRRGLQRTATENDATIANKRVPGLSRASTDTSLLIKGRNVKRESSEAPSLSAIPMLREKKAPRRDSAEKLRLLQKRTVSFNALSNSKKRKAAADEEVRAAIESIKRPNRGEAGREVADERDKRVSTAAKRQLPRKALITRPNVQVAATPKVHRKINIRDDAASIPHEISGDPEPPQNIPSTGATSRTTETVERARVHDAIGETPSFGRVKKLDLSTTQHARTYSGSLNFTKTSGPPVSVAGDLSTVSASETIFATPLKSIKWSQASPAAPIIALATPVHASKPHQKASTASHAGNSPRNHTTPQKATNNLDGDIYATLGWDDYGVDD